MIRSENHCTENDAVTCRFRNPTTNGGKAKVRVHRKRKIPKRILLVSPMSVESLWCCSVSRGQLFLSNLVSPARCTGGVLLSLLVAILEFLWHARKNHAGRGVSLPGRERERERSNRVHSVQHSIWWELIKELRFSIQCGASNRKALTARRCSQCTLDHGEAELCALTVPQSHPQQHFPARRHSPSNRSLSSVSVNSPTGFPTSKHRTTNDRTSELDKFDTLLMLAAERTNHLEKRSKSAQRHCSSSSQRKDIPLVLIEQQSGNHDSNLHPSHVRFLASPGK